MMDKGFIAPSINIDQLDPAAEGLPIVQTRKDVQVETAMSNSFGFGGTNATLIFSTKKSITLKLQSLPRFFAHSSRY